MASTRSLVGLTCSWTLLPAPAKDALYGLASILDDAAVAVETESELVVECRNSLPAVLNLIEAIEEIPICPICLAARIDDDEPHSRACPLAVFVSGQEEPQ